MLRGDLAGIGWLTERVSALRLVHEAAQAHVLDEDAQDLDSFDVVVVDSYRYATHSVNRVARSVPTLAIVDGDDRGIRAALYLDQNLGAVAVGSGVSLVGPRYALVRDEFVRMMRPRARRVGKLPRVLAFMGGSDALGSIVPVARSLSGLPPEVALDVVVADRWRRDVAVALSGRELLRLIEPTPRLAELAADADVVVSATGSSAWEICTIGVPAVFLAVVENQLPGFHALIDGGLALGADLTASTWSEPDIAGEVARILGDEQLRQLMFDAARTLFDGKGVLRVADAVEELSRGALRS